MYGIIYVLSIGGIIMINVICDLSNEQVEEVKEKLYSLNNIAICFNCNALIQFDDRDINREGMLSYIGCPCGKSVQLHNKYYK